VSSVFISYAKEDTAAARVLAGAIQEAGHSVWWDRHIPPGATWDEYIGRALDSAACVIVLWSRHSIESRWVREEADRAAKRDCLIPVLIEQVEPPFGFGRIQAADLSGWGGDGGDPAFGPVLAAVSRFARPQTVATPPRGAPRKRTALWIAAAAIAAIVGLYFLWPSGPRPPLPAPRQASPVSGTVLANDSPSLKLAWNAAPGARSYSVQYAFVKPGQPCAAGDPKTVEGLPSTVFDLRLVRGRAGCWRVWAVDRRGTEGAKSPWWEFLPPPQPPARPGGEPKNWIRLVHNGLYVAKFYLRWPGQTTLWSSGNRTIGYSVNVPLPDDVKTVLLNAQEQTGFGWKNIVRREVPVQRTYTISGTTLQPRWTASPPLVRQ
jgi:hypothetical protein